MRSILLCWSWEKPYYNKTYGFWKYPCFQSICKVLPDCHEYLFADGLRFSCSNYLYMLPVLWLQGKQVLYGSHKKTGLLLLRRMLITATAFQLQTGSNDYRSVFWVGTARYSDRNANSAAHPLLEERSSAHLPAHRMCWRKSPGNS